MVGPYTLANDKDDYDDGPLDAKAMVAEAIALANADVDFNDFDNDSDGWVDNVAVMYAGNGPDNGGYDGADPDANSLWPHASSLAAPVAVDGINAQTYYISPELLNASPRLRTIGVYAHEFGHKLGLPDLYDTDDAPNNSEGIGHWCLMSTGSWCSSVPGSENGESPSHMSAWCKSVLGWMSPTDLTGDSVAQAIPAAETSAFAVQLGSNPGGPDDWPGGSGEYFLVENRQRTGFDIGLDGCGILVWHIDEAMTSNRNQGHSAASHRLVDIEEADGLDELDASIDRGDAGDPFPGSTGNTLWNDTSDPHSLYYSGAASDFRMKVLTGTCDASMTATFGNTPPEALCQDVQVEADDACEGNVTPAMVDNGSSDPDGDPITLALDPPPPYALGVTNVTLVVTDDKGESDTCSAVVTVVDATPPTVVCAADIQVECSVAGGVPADDPQLAAFFAGFSAVDNCDDDLAVSNDAPALLPGPCSPGGGVTVVTWTAVDDAGNSAQCSATVTVVDTTPPEIAVSVAPQVLWPPNHKLVTVEYSVEVSDICDDAVTWELVSLTSNEPDNGLGDGDTADDIQGDDLGTADTSVRLRAERSGTGTGREYTATFEVADCSGNTASASVIVYVPHSKSDIGTILSGSSVPAARSETAYLIPGSSLRLPKDPDAPVAFDPLTGETRTIDPVSAFVGNTAGFVPASSFIVGDVDGDRYRDVLLSFDRGALEALAQASTLEDGAPVLVLETRPGSFRVLELSSLGTTELNLHGLIAALRVDSGDDGQEPPVDIAAPAPARPEGLIGAAPNPFNPSTTISFHLTDTRQVEVAIFDISGRRVARLLSQSLAAGDHAVQWHGADDQGNRVPSGVYIYRLSAGSLVESGRMMLLK